MRANFPAAFCLGLIVLGGCQTPIEYGPLGGEFTPIYGYQETETGKGEYILTIRAMGGAPESVHFMWDRRARELCGNEFQKTLYRAERPTTHYGSYGGAPGNMILEGFLHCGAATAGAPATAATPAPAGS